MESTLFEALTEIIWLIAILFFVMSVYYDRFSKAQTNVRVVDSLQTAKVIFAQLGAIVVMLAVAVTWFVPLGALLAVGHVVLLMLILAYVFMIVLTRYYS